MSGDEVVILVMCGAIAAVRWGHWFVLPATLSPVGRARRYPEAAWLGPLIAGGGLFLVLRVFAAADVRSSPVYLAFYMVMGAGWIGLTSLLFGWFGISCRDDLLERRNPAAGMLLTGALLGVALAFAGANIGNGPGWWVVLFCAALSTAAWLGSWAVLEGLTHAGESVTVDRDLPAALRLAAYLEASGLLLGRAVAGDWVSVEATLVDFARQGGIGAALLLAGALAGERLCQPAAEAGRSSLFLHGITPAAAYLLGALAYVVALGWWQ